MKLRTTHTYALMDVSPAVYAEIRAKIIEAGYEHTIMAQDGAECIDMTGIALQVDTSEPA